MTEKGCLTIAIPTYNRRESVRRAIKTIIPQLQRGDELLIVDDASQDGTPDFLRTIPEVRLISHSTNYGMTKAWNACLQSAHSEWICLVHDDDILSDQAIASIRKACVRAPGPAVIGSEYAGVSLGDAFWYEIREPNPHTALNTGFAPSGFAIHRSIVDAMGGFDEQYTYSPDLEYFPRVFLHYPVVLIKHPEVIRYQQHDQNYQYRTWCQPDFMQQLRSIEHSVVASAGLIGIELENRFQSRMSRHMFHMFKQAERLHDPELLHLTGRLVFQSPTFPLRFRLKALVAAVLGWLP